MRGVPLLESTPITSCTQFLHDRAFAASVELSILVLTNCHCVNGLCHSLCCQIVILEYAGGLFHYLATVTLCRMTLSIPTLHILSFPMEADSVSPHIHMGGESSNVYFASAFSLSQTCVGSLEVAVVTVCSVGLHQLLPTTLAFAHFT